MDNIVKFFEENFPKDTQFVFPQFERIENLDFDYVPSNVDEFTVLVEKAPFSILKGFGFRKWDTMNNVIKENKGKPIKNVISIPIINAPDRTLDVDCGRGSDPVDLLEEDEDIILFPKEWYDIIPNGFMVVGLHGEKYPFKKGVTDDDIRFGCLAYGITRKCNQKTENQ